MGLICCFSEEENNVLPIMRVELSRITSLWEASVEIKRRAFAHQQNPGILSSNRRIAQATVPILQLPRGSSANHRARNRFALRGKGTDIGRSRRQESEQRAMAYFSLLLAMVKFYCYTPWRSVLPLHDFCSCLTSSTTSC
eukprot:scaffold171559_cov34-Tisochrysis_lutea.AAC.1